jgi:hypothetical protein
MKTRAAAALVPLALLATACSDTKTVVVPTRQSSPAPALLTSTASPGASLLTLTVTSARGWPYAVTIDKLESDSVATPSAFSHVGLQGTATATNAGKGVTPGALFTLRAFYFTDALRLPEGVDAHGSALLSRQCRGPVARGIQVVKEVAYCAVDVELGGQGDPLRSGETENLSLAEPAAFAVHDADAATARTFLAHPDLVAVGVVDVGGTILRWSEALAIPTDTPVARPTTTRSGPTLAPTRTP